MGLKKVELFRGFNLFVEEVRAGAWRVSAVEIPASSGTETARPPSQGRVPGEHASKEAALVAARAHVDRIHANRKNRVSQP
jgi:hypothetical protein